MGIFQRLQEGPIIDDPDTKNRKKLEKDLKYLENLNIGDLNEVVLELRRLKEDGIYKNLIETFAKVDEDDLYKNGAKLSKEEIYQIPFLRIAAENLTWDSINKPIRDYPVILQTVEAMANFFLRIYYLNTGQPLSKEDVLGLSYTLFERITFFLDDFDKVNEKNFSFSTFEFFQRLKKVTWQNKETKNFFKFFSKVMERTRYDIFGYGLFIGVPFKYDPTEDFFILFLTGCSTVNNERLEIIPEDIIRAYITFFRLINVDITQIKPLKETYTSLSGKITTKMEIFQENPTTGYLVCDKCGGFYQLKHGESENDFSDSCECGGKLEYKETPE